MIKEFFIAYHEYGRQRMMNELSKLPKGTWEYKIKHDGIPDLLPEGITIKIKAITHPEDGSITIDLRDNDFCKPCGLNLCEATTIASARTGVLNHLPADLPHNEGAMSRINVLLREGGSCIGAVKYPYSASVATTNVADRLISGVQALFNQISTERGMAEGGAVMCPAVSVISGLDWRRNDEPYVNQLFCGMTGGPGVKNHDGWVTMQFPCTGGGLYWTSTEVLEQRYPVKVLEEEVLVDSVGPGEFDSAPACKFVITPRKHPMVAAYVCDGIENPPKGCEGGLSGHPAAAWKYDIEKGESSRYDLPAFAAPEIRYGEALVSESTSGGGFGNPLKRDPEKVLHRVKEGWITKEFAKRVYGVKVYIDSGVMKVDYEETNKLRNELKN